MHRPEYVRLIQQASRKLGITVSNFADNWAIKLSKAGVTKYIIGYAFPLNNAASLKIARHKDVCSEILTAAGIPNVPHFLLYSPKILLRRNSSEGNTKTISRFVSCNGFPFVVKRNESSKGDGVFLIQNQSELEEIISRVSQTDSTFSLSPYRDILHEYRNIVLDGDCLLSYEKLRPYVVGDGHRGLFHLIVDQYKNESKRLKFSELFQADLINRLDGIPQEGEKVYLQWKHNATAGMLYKIIDNHSIKEIAEMAAKAIDARFVSVDIIESQESGLEVLEINSSVVMNVFVSRSEVHYSKALDVYQAALERLFEPCGE